MVGLWSALWVDQGYINRDSLNHEAVFTLEVAAVVLTLLYFLLLLTTIFRAAKYGLMEEMRASHHDPNEISQQVICSQMSLEDGPRHWYSSDLCTPEVTGHSFDMACGHAK